MFLTEIFKPQLLSSNTLHLHTRLNFINSVACFKPLFLNAKRFHTKLTELHSPSYLVCIPLPFIWQSKHSDECFLHLFTFIIVYIYSCNVVCVFCLQFYFCNIVCVFLFTISFMLILMICYIEHYDNL